MQLSTVLLGVKIYKEKIEGRKKIKINEHLHKCTHVATGVEIMHIHQREEKYPHLRKLAIPYYTFVPSLQHMLHLLGPKDPLIP